MNYDVKEKKSPVEIMKEFEEEIQLTFIED